MALTHDVDTPWRWTAIGLRGAAARLKACARRARPRCAAGDARSPRSRPQAAPHRPELEFRARDLAASASGGAGSTFFVMAGHRHAADGATPDVYDRLRPRLVETLSPAGPKSACTGATRPPRTRSRLARGEGELERTRRARSKASGTTISASTPWEPGVARRARLRLRQLARLRRGARLPRRDRPSFPALGLRPRAAARPRRDSARWRWTRPSRRATSTCRRARRTRTARLLESAAERGGGFSVLWHTERFDRGTARGWDRLYDDLLSGVRDRGGICLSAGELADEAAAWLGADGSAWRRSKDA